MTKGLHHERVGVGSVQEIGRVSALKDPSRLSARDISLQRLSFRHQENEEQRTRQSVQTGTGLQRIPGGGP
jgi:hypothetical protein